MSDRKKIEGRKRGTRKGDIRGIKEREMESRRNIQPPLCHLLPAEQVR